MGPANTERKTERWGDWRPAAARLALAAVATAGAISTGSAPGAAQEIGDPMPPLIVGEWIQGGPEEAFAWGDGKVYLLDLWGTWCQPCVALMPRLSDLHERYRARGFAVIGYSWEEPAVVQRFLGSRGDLTRYWLVTDPAERTLQELASAEAIEGFPYAFLIDGDGIVRWKGPGQGAESAVKAFFRDSRE